MAVLWLAPFLLLLLRCGASDELPFVRQTGGAPWIMAPTPVSARLEQWGVEEPGGGGFRRRFRLDSPVPATRLELRVLGDASVTLDGAELGRVERPAAGRGPAADTLELPGLAAGAHELRVEVRNARGPALLSLRAEGLPDLASGPSWSARRGEETFAPAILADDTRTSALALAVESPGEAARRAANPLLLLLTLGGVGFLLARGRFGDAAWRRLAWGVPIGSSLAWAWLQAKALRIPPEVGFDARHHLQYVAILLEQGRLPLADEGWSTYHPPLFYALSSLAASIGGQAAALKVLPLLAGLGLVWVSWWLARRLLPASPEHAALAALFAATLPVNLYTASYFSNESLHALLAGAALTSCALLLLAEGLPRRGLAVSALLFGLAALTKFTVLVTVPVALFFLGWKLWLVERAGAGRSVGGVAVFAGVFAAVAGWFYLRTWLDQGAPIVGNWALPGAHQVWWQQPGFHTIAWYGSFGESLARPYFSGFHSFWDALYSTLWGDGFVAGRASPTLRHDFWNYDLMSAGYWVALPATPTLLLGLALLCREAFRHPDPRRRVALLFLLTASWAVFLAFLSLTLELPFFTQAKAAYLSMLTPVLALAFAVGFAALDRWLDSRSWLPARVLLYGWLALLAGTFFLAFAG
ncbi:MAG: hypothetical protein QNK04_18615 [Myxococcota bacterium]|nr:hypothetical protein [Myxococcota bacterium]